MIGNIILSIYNYEDNVTSIKQNDGTIDKLAYNDFGMMTSFKNKKKEVLYKYDAQDNRIQAKTTDLLKKNNYHNKKDTETQFDVLQTKIEYLDKTFNCDISLNNSGDYTQLGYSFNGNKTKDDSVETVDYINDLNKENTQVLSSNSNMTKNSKTFVYGYDKIKENNDYYVEKINGSISKVLDSKGNTKKSYEYSDYGQELNGYKDGFTYNKKEKQNHT